MCPPRAVVWMKLSSWSTWRTLGWGSPNSRAMSPHGYRSVAEVTAPSSPCVRTVCERSAFTSTRSGTLLSRRLCSNSRITVASDDVPRIPCSNSTNWTITGTEDKDCQSVCIAWSFGHSWAPPPVHCALYRENAAENCFTPFDGDVCLGN
jgi:hypothetical protein